MRCNTVAATTGSGAAAASLRGWLNSRAPMSRELQLARSTAEGGRFEQVGTPRGLKSAARSIDENPARLRQVRIPITLPL